MLFVLTIFLSFYLFFGSLEASLLCRALNVVFLSLLLLLLAFHLHSFFRPPFRCFSRQILPERPFLSIPFSSQLTQFCHFNNQIPVYMCVHVSLRNNMSLTLDCFPAIKPLYPYRMPSKQLMGFWWFFNFTLLAAGAVSTALSVVWGRPDLLMNLTLNAMDLKRMSSPPDYCPTVA